MGGHPRNANNLIAVLSRLMTWCEARGWRASGSNPCRGIQRYKENKRNRYLSPDEAKKLGEVLKKAEADGSENIFVIAAIWLIIFTGRAPQRDPHFEVGRRRHVAGDANAAGQQVWSKDGSLKQASHRCPRALSRVGDNPYVFIGHVRRAHLVNIAKPWGRIRKAAGLPGLRLHDLRLRLATALLTPVAQDESSAFYLACKRGNDEPFMRMSPTAERCSSLKRPGI